MSLYQPTERQQISRLPAIDVGDRVFVPADAEAAEPERQQVTRLPAVDPGDRVTVLCPAELAGQVETVTRLIAIKHERSAPARWFLVLSPSGRVVSPKTVRRMP
jgi:hypothetical protein